MAIYFNTYNYILKKNKEKGGNYSVTFEDPITDIIYENNIKIIYYNHKYKLIQKSSQPK